MEGSLKNEPHNSNKNQHPVVFVGDDPINRTYYLRTKRLFQNSVFSQKVKQIASHKTRINLIKNTAEV